MEKLLEKRSGEGGGNQYLINYLMLLKTQAHCFNVYSSLSKIKYLLAVKLKRFFVVLKS